MYFVGRNAVMEGQRVDCDRLSATHSDPYVQVMIPSPSDYEPTKSFAR